jgi:outer membrane protein OmpA-like peptidoglycan-associated protein
MISLLSFRQFTLGICRAWLVASLFLACGQMQAQSASSDIAEEFLAKVFVPPPLVNFWGIGVFGGMKAGANTDFNVQNNLSRPTLNSSLSFIVPNYSWESELLPDYGLTLYFPILFGSFGANLDLGVTTYKYGTQYQLKNVVRSDTALRRLGVDVEAAPAFLTRLSYFTASPMINFNGIQLGARIGIPFTPNVGSITLPASLQTLGWNGGRVAMDASALATFVEARLGALLPIATFTFGILHFTADVTYPLTNYLTNTELTNDLVKSGFQGVGVPVQDDNRGQAGNRWFPVQARPVTISAGLNFVFTFNNAAEIAQFKEEQRITDSIRAEERKINARVLVLQRRSTALADSIAASVIATMQMKERLAQLESQREQARQDSIKHALAMQVEKAKIEALRSKEEAVKSKEEAIKSKEETAKTRKELAKSKQDLAKSKEELTESKKKVFTAVARGIFGGSESAGKDGSGLPEVKELVVEQFPTKLSRALLPYIFFENNSSVLPARYKRLRAIERNAWQMPIKQELKPLAVYNEILNIVGKRLTQYPNARLTLIGCNANEGDEKDNYQLSLKRAETVSSYLQDVWKIPAKRIEYRSRNLPSSPSTGSTPETQAENRRVELSSDAPEILAPITIEFMSRVAMPPVLAFGLDINSGAGLKQWTVEIQQLQGKSIETLKDTTGGSVCPERFIWWLNSEPATIPASSEPITVRVEAFDVNNAQSPDAPLISLPVRQITPDQKRKNGQPDKRIHTYELLAGSAPSEVRPFHPLTESLLASIGATYPVGTAEAQATVVYGGNNAPTSAFVMAAAKALKLNAQALQPNATPVDMSIPEGRFYARSLVVRVETTK